MFAQKLARACQELNAFQPGLVIYLQGDLGAGKTAFSRAFIQTFLPQQRVKSPTYTLVESYKCEQGTIFHFDLYRLCEPEELVYLGVRDQLVAPFMALVEWPDKGGIFLPKADLVLSLMPFELGRNLYVEACSEVAKHLMASLYTI